MKVHLVPVSFVKIRAMKAMLINFEPDFGHSLSDFG